MLFLQAKLEGSIVELEQKIKRRQTQVDEINASLKTCKVGCKRENITVPVLTWTKKPIRPVCQSLNCQSKFSKSVAVKWSTCKVFIDVLRK